MVISYNKPHKTQKAVVKEILVDRGIKPVVDWLNSFLHVFTQHSCEDDGREAYVIFFCHDALDLLRISQAIEYLGSIQVGYYSGSLRYSLSFSDQAKFDSFRDSLIRRNKEN